MNRPLSIEVTVFDITENKPQDALPMGADASVIVNNQEELP